MHHENRDQLRKAGAVVHEELYPHGMPHKTETHHEAPKENDHTRRSHQDQPQEPMPETAKGPTSPNGWVKGH